MFESLKYWSKSEDGAVTVDWVVLTAAIVGLGLVSVGIQSPIRSLATDIREMIEGVNVQPFDPEEEGEGG